MRRCTASSSVTDGAFIAQLPLAVLTFLPSPLLHSFGTQPLRARSHLPDLVVILNPAENGGLVRECTISQVPTIGIVDTDTDPRLVTYAVPANVEVRERDLF